MYISVYSNSYSVFSIYCAGIKSKKDFFDGYRAEIDRNIQLMNEMVCAACVYGLHSVYITTPVFVNTVCVCVCVYAYMYVCMFVSVHRLSLHWGRIMSQGKFL